MYLYPLHLSGSPAIDLTGAPFPKGNTPPLPAHTVTPTDTHTQSGRTDRQVNEAHMERVTKHSPTEKQTQRIKRERREG